MHLLHHMLILPWPFHLDTMARNVAEEDPLQTPSDLGFGDKVQTQGLYPSSSPELQSLNDFLVVGPCVTDLERGHHFNVSRAPPLHQPRPEAPLPPG